MNAEADTENAEGRDEKSLPRDLRAELVTNMATTFNELLTKQALPVSVIASLVSLVETTDFTSSNVLEVLSANISGQPMSAND